MSLIALAVLGKTIYTMTAKRSYWMEVASLQKKDSVKVKPTRGNILSCDGQLMASSIPEFKVYMDLNALKAAGNDTAFVDSINYISKGLNNIFPEKSAAYFKKYLMEGYHKESKHWAIWNERIDYNTFKDKFGMPFEVFTHVQHTKSSEYVDFIASGLDLPIDEVREVYDKYKEQTDKVNKKKDSFLNESNELKILQTDDMFDVNNTKASISSDDFFKSMGVEAGSSTVEVLGEGATGVKVIKHKEFLDSLSENN